MKEIDVHYQNRNWKIIIQLFHLGGKTKNNAFKINSKHENKVYIVVSQIRKQSVSNYLTLDWINFAYMFKYFHSCVFQGNDIKIYTVQISCLGNSWRNLWLYQIELMLLCTLKFIKSNASSTYSEKKNWSKVVESDYQCLERCIRRWEMSRQKVGQYRVNFSAGTTWSGFVCSLVHLRSTGTNIHSWSSCSPTHSQ